MASTYRDLWELLKKTKYVKVKVLQEDAWNCKRGVIKQKDKDKAFKLMSDLTKFVIRTSTVETGMYATIEFYLDEHPVKRIEKGLLL